ncbi:MAG: efflux RND transporter periplasmic adaptor subunit [Gemmatimonadales bacterium]|nr:efflux RND transporter periplasmic adaptor subunit [Gemmatimonadales bacterium]MYG48262.1 efflux RND transporter periplasmic adaptor subunit [Gemmatimonadales bacterium]MYK01446.1 efflux RND transporter periplasmic adaptor subunit [Candidatus Palauibacter ramosifaciens]
MRVNRAVAMVAALSGAGCDAPSADQAAAATHSHAGGGVVTHWTESLELFAEYPPHVQDVASEPWAIHLTWLADWKPVREGRLVLLLRGPGGAREEIVLAAPASPGVYSATPTLTATGTWRADLTLTARGADHAIPVGQLRVFASEEVLPHDEEPPRPGLIALLKEEQWAMPFEVAVAATRRIPQSIPVTGEVAAPARDLAHVSTPVGGLLLVQGPSPAPGEEVREGETLALIAPTSLDDSYARMRADVEDAEREADRAERLLAAGAIAGRRLEEALHNLEVARAAFAAVDGRRSADVDGGGDGGSDPHVYRLRSPIGGVIADRRVAPGEHVAVGRHAFTVVRPDTLWFVARVPARHAEAAGDVHGAWFTVEGATRAHAADRVVSVGSIIDAGSRTLPVRFAVANPDGVLKVGMLAEGHLLLGDPVEGVAVPTPAILDEDGLSVVYVKVGGEAFQRRVVETGPSDGSWTIVHSGVASGEQVVAVGAYQVRLASLGDVEISDHGHPH